MRISAKSNHLTALACFLLIGVTGGFAHDEADQLVQSALRAELNGANEERFELLAKALEANPDFAPARWHSGQVPKVSRNGKLDRNSEQEWLSVEEAEKSGAEDKILADYAKMRDAKTDDAAGHEALALWCQRRGMMERAKIHWARVLRFDPNHRTAPRRLGLKKLSRQLVVSRTDCPDQKPQSRSGEVAAKMAPQIAGLAQSVVGQ